MRNLFSGCLAALLITISFAASAQTVENGRGDLPLTVPASYDAANPTPLFVLLHGYTSSGAGQDSYMRFSALADAYGFIMVAPDGTVETAGDKNRFWNASAACCNFQGSDVDDSAYLAGLIDNIKAEYNIDDKRVFLFGHSNGGFMSFRMAYDHSDTIAAVATLAGANQTQSRTPGGPVHVLQIHGTADGTIAYEGDSIGANSYPSAKTTVETWAAHNGCATTGKMAGSLDLVATLDGAESEITRYTDGCKPGGSAELWTIADGSHVPAISEHFSQLVIEWLMAHPKP